MVAFLTGKQQAAFQYFQDNLEKLAADPLYKFKYIIIYNGNIAGVHDTFEAALSKYPQNEFIIQQVITDNDIVGFLLIASVSV